MTENRNSWIRAALLAVCLSALGILAVPFFWPVFGPTPEIRFVLPPGFRGGFIVVEDDNGVDLGGRFARLYKVVVPTSRVVKVRSLAPFHAWHTTTVQTDEDGRGSRVNFVSPPDDAIELRGGELSSAHFNGVDYRTRIKFVFGTAADELAFDPYSVSADPNEPVISEDPNVD